MVIFYLWFSNLSPDFLPNGAIRITEAQVGTGTFLIRQDWKSRRGKGKALYLLKQEQLVSWNQNSGEVLSRWQGLSVPSSAHDRRLFRPMKSSISFQQTLIMGRVQCSRLLASWETGGAPLGTKKHLSLPEHVAPWGQLKPVTHTPWRLHHHFPVASSKCTQIGAGWLKPWVLMMSYAYFLNHALSWPQGEK